MGEYFDVYTVFNDMLVIFKIISINYSKSLLGFSCFDGVWYKYKVKGNVNYAKKIISNIVKHFENSSVDCYDIDLCLRKTFALKPLKYKNKAKTPNRHQTPNRNCKKNRLCSRHIRMCRGSRWRSQTR